MLKLDKLSIPYTALQDVSHIAADQQVGGGPFQITWQPVTIPCVSVKYWPCGIKWSEKLGDGVFSTVWLAPGSRVCRRLDSPNVPSPSQLTRWISSRHCHVALKVFVRAQAMGKAADHEMEIYKHMATVSSTSGHPGRTAVRTLLDSFEITGPDGEHQCLVRPPL